MQGQKYKSLILYQGDGRFNLSSKSMMKLIEQAPKLLEEGGFVVTLAQDMALSLANVGSGADLVVKTYSPPDALFTRYPRLVPVIQGEFPEFSYLSEDFFRGSFRQSLFKATVPILTPAGVIRHKKASTNILEEFCLLGIDGDRCVGKIIEVLCERRGTSENDVIELLLRFEAEGIIYPISKRVDFLTSCYQKKTSFRIGRFFVACGLLADSQLGALLEEQEELLFSKNVRKPIGQLAQEAGYLNEAYLRLLLKDQALYSQHINEFSFSGFNNKNAGDYGGSFFGTLGAVDQAMLLQTIASARRSGLLTVEGERGNLVVAFEDGLPRAAKMNRVRGRQAVVEFLALWNEGLFSFRESSMEQQLKGDCLFKGALDRLLLDGAFVSDLISQIFSALPQREETILERVWNFEQLCQNLQREPLLLLDETKFPPDEWGKLQELTANIDGLLTIREVLNLAPEFSFHKGLFLIQAFIERGLVTFQQGVLVKELNDFEKLLSEHQSSFPKEELREILEFSLELCSLDGTIKEIISLGYDNYPQLNHAALRREGVPIQAILEKIKLWRSNYLTCILRLKPDLLEKLNES
jgi:hypothetical protein